MNNQITRDLRSIIEGYTEMVFGWKLTLDGHHRVHLEHATHSDIAAAVGHDPILGVVVSYRDATKVPRHVRYAVKRLIQKSMYRAAALAG